MELTELQKSNFLRLYCMVMADGVVEAKELESLYRIGRENYNLSSEEINKCVISSGSTFIPPTNSEDCISILYEMAEVAWADGKIDNTEIDLLARYAVRFGYKEENAKDIANFLLSQVKNGVCKSDVINQIINA